MKPIQLKLTDDQRKALEPLFRQVNAAASRGKEHRGVIFAQIHEGRGGIQARFVPADLTARIIPVLRIME